MSSLVAARSRPLPVVVRRQLSRAVVVQRHCHAVAWVAGGYTPLRLDLAPRLTLPNKKLTSALFINYCT